MMRSISLTKSQNVTAAALIREPFGMLADDSFQSACCEDAAIIVELLSISLCTKNDFRRGYVEKSRHNKGRVMESHQKCRNCPMSCHICEVYKRGR
ncbi:hypothetical protein Plhal304r1_c010g0038031 [Plasmopara halstedii]